MIEKKLNENSSVSEVHIQTGSEFQFHQHKELQAGNTFSMICYL